MSITCVAYGNPAPWIVWSSESQDVENYAQPKRDGVNVNSMNYTDPTTGLVLAVSILEMCDVGYNATRIMDFTCTALNDLSDAGQPLLGVSNRATFDILPESEWQILLVMITMLASITKKYCVPTHTHIHSCTHTRTHTHKNGQMDKWIRGPLVATGRACDIPPLVVIPGPPGATRGTCA